MVRTSVFWFAALVALAVAAFWPSYVRRLADVGAEVHVHAAGMTLWCLLLVAQGALIRSGRRDLHRALGRASYVLVPLIVVGTLVLARHMLRSAQRPLPEEALYFLYIQLSLLAVFAYAYVAAIRHRREPPVHGAYMIGTALALVDPIGARLLHQVGLAPPLMQVVTYGIVDAVLVALLVHERRRPARPRVFARLLAVFVLAQVPTFFVARVPAWRAFAETLAAR
jgi:hypothetical protein